MTGYWLQTTDNTDCQINLISAKMAKITTNSHINENHVMKRKTYDTNKQTKYNFQLMIILPKEANQQCPYL